MKISPVFYQLENFSGTHQGRKRLRENDTETHTTQSSPPSSPSSEERPAKKQKREEQSTVASNPLNFVTENCSIM